MKLLARLICAGVQLLLIGSIVFAYADQGHHEEAGRPPQREHQAGTERQRPGTQNREAQPPRHASPPGAQQAPRDHGRQVQGPQEHNRSSLQRRPFPQREQRGLWQQHRARSWESEHRSWRQRGGYRGYRIPEDRYRRYFGPYHRFRIYLYPVIVVGGYPRFRYGGFWFSLVDPWPEYWSDDWYDNDDVYIDYFDDGYYLYNPRYPRDRIAIMVYLR